MVRLYRNVTFREGTTMHAVQRYLPVVVRYLMGLIFFVFGLNGFLHFLPQPPMEGGAAAFAGALFATGYMFPLLKTFEVISGALLLGNRFVPLALAMLAPITVNIFFFHTVLTPPNPIAFIVLIGNAYLAFAYRDAFRPMLAAKAKPVAPEAAAAAAPVRAPV
jgi:uncharacterized membrane protein YphA (DoxX/SURF4 family)